MKVSIVNARRRLVREDGAVSSWLIIAAGLAMVAAVAASILSTTVTQLASAVGYAAQVQPAGATGPPGPATEPVAALDTGGVLIAWDDVPGATSYRLLRNGEPVLEAATTSVVDNSAFGSDPGSDDAVYSVEAFGNDGNLLEDAPEPRMSEMRFGFPEPGETTTSEITVYTEDVRGPGTITQSTALDGSTFELTQTDLGADGQYSDRQETFADGTSQHITVVNGVVVNNYQTDIFGNPLPGGLVDGEVVPEPPPPPPPANNGNGNGNGDGGGGSTNGQGSNSLTNSDDGPEVCGSCGGSGGGGYDNPALNGHPSAAG